MLEVINEFGNWVPAGFDSVGKMREG